MAAVSIDEITGPLIISFSGGRSSAVMTKLLLDRYSEKLDIHVVFANTGSEDPATLDFVRDCDLHWGFNTTWIEGVYSLVKGIGPRHKIVDYETASRDHEPFRSFLSSYQSDHAILQCTKALKIRPVQSWIKSLGLDANHTPTAIGIRADEIDRSVTTDPRMFCYPLLEWGYTKDRVKAFMRSAPFDLNLPSDIYGNCTFCWKKSKRKLLTLATESPECFDFPAEMEAKHPKWAWYRGSLRSSDLLALASRGEFRPYVERVQYTIWDAMESDPDLDIGGACGEGCEIN